nr:MAG TPA: hypothetical protein [Caudoviricetes sp.]
MLKNLSNRIDAPRLSCYSECDAVLATHGLHLPLFKSSRRRVLFPLTPRREASFHFTRKRPLLRFFSPRQTTFLLKQ